MLSLPIIDETSNGSLSTGKPLAGVLMPSILAIDSIPPQEERGVWPYGWQARRGHPAGLGAKENADGRRLFPRSRRISEGR